MIRKITFFLFFALTLIQFIVSCERDTTPSANEINPSGETIKDRIPAPQGYSWIEEDDNSFGEFLTHLPVKEDGAQIYDYSNQPIGNQFSHIAVIDLDIGNRDLQQCADAVIRLRSDYLWNQKRFNEIEFHFTSGHLFKWNDYKNGIRPQVTNNNQVTFSQTASKDDSLESYRKYLDIIYMYAGTISLNKETKAITNDKDIQTGTIIITPGSPGHVVVVVGKAENSKGKKVYLLAQGYTPAQSIHVLKNPDNSSLDPWYKLSISDPSTQTARYGFEKTNLRNF